MTFQIDLMLASLAVAVVLFSLEWFTADSIALGLLVTLVRTGLLPVERAFEGFGCSGSLAQNIFDDFYTHTAVSLRFSGYPPLRIPRKGGAKLNTLIS